MSNKQQNRDGLPASIAEEQRFFELRSFDKTATPAGWNTPANWLTLDEIPERRPFGYAVGNNSTKLLVDYDHVISNGKVTPWIKEVILRLRKVCSTYFETSMSGTGYHQIVDLADYADSFAPESNGYNNIIVDMPIDEYRALSKEERDQVPKIEFWFKVEGRYVFLTGQHSAFNEVAKDEEAAAFFRELLLIRQEMREKHRGNGQNGTSQNGGLQGVRFEIDEETRKRVLEALPYVSANCSRDEWVHVGIALHHCGFPFELWDTWSQYRDQRTGEASDKYHEGETEKTWRSFENNQSHWNAGTIFRLAKEQGWKGGRRNRSNDADMEIFISGKKVTPTDSDKEKPLRPLTFTDLGQAAIFCREYGDRVRYSKATDFLVYDGKAWRENELNAQGLAQALTIRQLKEARELLRKAQDELTAAQEAAAGAVVDVVSGDANSNVKQAESKVKLASSYHSYVLGRQKSASIANTLKESRPSVQIDVKELDADGFLLNTPAGTVNLKTGQMMPHNPKDYCTKITGVAPSGENAELYFDFINQVTSGDTDLARYLQEVAGMCAVGKVFSEKLIIAYGGGGNGKSSLFNLWADVLGDYAGTIPSEELIVRAGNAKSYSIANLRGKRLIIAAELREGARLSTDAVKKMCSTDKISAEQKYKDPFEFRPSHSIVLYTNHLPRVNTNDSGTWSRLTVVPFRAKFRGRAGEIKNYASYLFQRCGGAVLEWIIEGAQRFIANGGDIALPDCVRSEIQQYKDRNDWLSDFISECCMVDKNYSIGSGALYKAYSDYCQSIGEYKRSKADFNAALEQAGYKRHRGNKGTLYYGITIMFREYGSKSSAS